MIDRIMETMSRSEWLLSIRVVSRTTRNLILVWCEFPAQWSTLQSETKRARCAAILFSSTSVVFSRSEHGRTPDGQLTKMNVITGRFEVRRNKTANQSWTFANLNRTGLGWGALFQVSFRPLWIGSRTFRTSRTSCVLDSILLHPAHVEQSLHFFTCPAFCRLLTVMSIVNVPPTLLNILLLTCTDPQHFRPRQSSKVRRPIHLWHYVWMSRTTL